MRMTSIYLRRFADFLKSVVRQIACVVIHYSGITRICELLKRGPSGIRILAYHDIADKGYLNLQVSEKTFTMHVQYLLKNNYNIISLEEAADLLRSGGEIPRKTVVITFDDGYKSIYQSVLPIVKEYGLPITVFLSTGSVGSSNGGTPLFVDAVAYAIRKTTKNELDLSTWNYKRFSLKTALLRELAVKQVNEYSKNLAPAERRNLLHFILGQLDIDIEADELKNKMLSWDEIKEMDSAGVSFGAHTHTHPSLSRITLKEARDEIMLSKRLIENHLGKEVTTFAYPYGSVRDVNDGVRDIVEQEGFKCACVLKDGINLPGDDLYMMKRACITNQINSDLLGFVSKAEFSVQMTGVLNFIYNIRERMMSRGSEGTRKKINILYIIDQFKAGGGTERHLVRLATMLDRERFNTAISCFEGAPGTILDDILKHGIPVEDLNLSRIYSYRALARGFRLARFIRRHGIDIVQTFHFKSDTFGVFFSRLAGVPIVVSSRRDTGDLKKPRQILLNRIMNRFIDRFIMVCNAVGTKVRECEGVPAHKTVTIYNGVDLKRFSGAGARDVELLRRQLGLDDSNFVVGISAIFRPEKAYHVFFKGIEGVLSTIKNLKVLVLGFGPTKDHFVSYCRKGPLREVVKFQGFVEDVERFLPLMDVFCLVPNKNEGFSNAILEAMAAGRPVIASDVGGNAEAVVHNETGIIIPPDDPAALSRAILELYNNPEKRLQMGQKARERAAESFSIEKMIREHESFYETLYSEYISGKSASEPGVVRRRMTG